VTGSEDGGFCDIVINKDSDGVKAIRHREFCDKVHGYGREWGGIGERGNWVERNRGSIG